MEDLDFSMEYIAMLQSAMCRPEARTFVLSRLELSLESIGIDTLCRRDILRLLMTLVRDKPLVKQEVLQLIGDFERRWHTHLDRAYLRDYEATRWSFFEKFVFSQLPSSVGRCLDVGCGRGCVTASVVHKGIATEAVGIDETDFSMEWYERFATSRANISYQHVPVEDIIKWSVSNGKFDTVLLFYVLHHSSDYWVSKTLDSLSSALKKDGCLVILEDSFVEGVQPAEDNDNLYQRWAAWSRLAPHYLLTVGYDVQALLDFVAVQLLARFNHVQMSSNYKTATDWCKHFACLGYDVASLSNIGFPQGRDIDVPQALFVLKQRK